MQFKKEIWTTQALKTFIVKIKNKEQVKKGMTVLIDTVNFDTDCFKEAVRNEKDTNNRGF